MMDQSQTRRNVIKRAGTTVVTAAGLASVVDVAAADTDSGHVELTTTATVPQSTSISITVLEDTSGDGTADRQQTKTISDGTATTEFGELRSITTEGHTLWLEVGLSTADDSVTPSLDSATLTLPETFSEPQPPSEPIADEPQTIDQVWQNYRAFVAMTVIFFAGVGLWSRSLTLAAWAGYVAFLHIALTSGTPLFENIAYVTLVLVFLGFAFKLTRLEFEGEA